MGIESLSGDKLMAQVFGVRFPDRVGYDVHYDDQGIKPEDELGTNYAAMTAAYDEDHDEGRDVTIVVPAWWERRRT